MFFGKGERTTRNKIFMKFFNMHRSMMSRCYNKKSKSFNRYGAIGVIVSKEWHDLDYFLETIELVEGFDLDKIMEGKLELDKDIKSKGNKIYSIDTCKFISKSENCGNRCNNREFVAVSPNYTISYHKNREKFARENNMSTRTIFEKLNKGGTYRGWQFFYKEIFNISKIKYRQEYIITYPNGKIIEYDDKISKFARENNLNEANIFMVISGKSTNHKGFQFWKKEDFSKDKILNLKKQKYLGISPNNSVFIFDNITQFSKAKNLSQSNVSICINGKKDKYKEWVFKKI